MTFYVETCREAYPSKSKLTLHVFRESQYSVDCLSPCMTAVFRVRYVRTANEAMAAVAEHAAGFGVDCQLIMGGRKAGAA